MAIPSSKNAPAMMKSPLIETASPKRASLSPSEGSSLASSIQFEPSNYVGHGALSLSRQRTTSKGIKLNDAENQVFKGGIGR